MGHTRPLHPSFRHRMAGAAALIILLVSLGAAPVGGPRPAHATDHALTEGSWRRVQLGESRRSATYSVTSDKDVRIFVVSTDRDVAVDISPADRDCPDPDGRRRLFSIDCFDVGTHEVTVSLESDYSGDSISTYLIYDEPTSTTFRTISSDSAQTIAVSANGVYAFRFSQSSGSTRYCVELSGDNGGVSHLMARQSGSLVSYSQPGSPRPNERPSYSLSSSDAPFYLILLNSSDSGRQPRVKLRPRSGSNPC